MIEISFENPLPASFTDKLEDTVCYFQLVQFIEDRCENKYFSVIEHLTQTIYETITEFILPFHKFFFQIRIRTHKISPPVKNVHGGVSFTYNVCARDRNLYEISNSNVSQS